MPQILIAAASAISFTATGAIVFSLSTFALNAALGFLLTALSPKSRTTPAGASYSGESVDSAAPQQIIYGRTKVGGVKIYTEETGNNKFLHKVIAYAGHEIQSYDEIYLNDELLTLDGTGNVTSPSKYSGFVRIKTHLGSPDQVADSDLVAESAGLWSVNHRLRGIAYIYARFKFHADKYPNGEPIITVVVKGKKVYDPRTGLTAWSGNSALCLRDYITSDYCLSELSDNVDDVLFSSAANICAEMVTNLNVTEERYSCDGAILASTKPVDGINAILLTMGGTVWFSQGMWRLKAAAWTTPTQTLTDDDLRSGVSISTKNSRRDTFNIVGGLFRGAESKWTEDQYPDYKSPTFINDDGGLESRVDVDLLMVNSSPRAQRIAKIALYRNREQLTVSATFSLRAISIQVGEIVYMSYARAGWISKPFEVQSWNFALDDDMSLAVQMTLREISSAVFDWYLADETVFQSNNTNLVNPFYVEPIGILVSSTTNVIYEKLTNVLYVSVTSTDPSKIRVVEVEFKKSTDTIWSPMGSGQIGVYSYVDVDDSPYDIRARATNYLDVSSDYTIQTGFVINGLIAPPTDVARFAANLSGGSINLTWQATPDPDLSYYLVRHSVEESGATFANATTASQKVSRPATSISLPSRPGTYHIKSYDKTKIASVNYTSAVITSAMMPVFANNPTLSFGPTFTGTKVNTEVVSSQLRLTDFTTDNTSGTFDLNGYIDTGAARRINSRLDVYVNRFATGFGLWDSMVGLWDSWAALWDDWTGAVQLPDTNVVCYISYTNDDPAASPVWSAYYPFTAGEFYGRAFRFRVELISETATVSPSISSLVARVSY